MKKIIYANLVEEVRRYFSDFLFDGLTSVPRSKDMGLEYYKSMLKGRTEEEIRKFSDLCAEKIVKKYLTLTKGEFRDILDAEKDKIISESLEETAKEFFK